MMRKKFEIDLKLWKLVTNGDNTNMHIVFEIDLIVWKNILAPIP